ncbi:MULTISPECIES: amino acid adenylation domain-containing protein [unclassified Streptomyces]|uniref:non-ribosomal peptide synthetase n=1 Tax=unclassified Streptomyces TaxID=2593676 RepID=UPI00381E858F
MHASPTQQRFTDVWGARTPETRIVVAHDAGITQADIRERLRSAVDRHEVLQADGAHPEPSPATTDPADPATLTWREGVVTCALGSGPEGEHRIELRAPADRLDATAAARLAATLIGDAAYEGPGQADLAAWAWETLAAREADGVTHWDGAEQSCAAVPPLPWGRNSAPAELRPAATPIAWGDREHEALHRCAAALGASAADVLCAAWTALLARWFDLDTLLLGDTVDGRDLDELGAVPGLLERTLPLSLTCDHDRDFAALAREVAEERRKAAAFQDYFVLPSGTDTSRCLPLAFVWRDPDLVDGTAPRSRVVSLDSLVEPFSLRLDARTSPDGVDLHLAYDSTLVAPPLAEELRDCLPHFVLAACERPETPLGDLPLTAGPAPRTPWEENPPPALVDPGPGIRRRLADVVASAPERPALRHHGVVRTYAELVAGADEIAGRLTRLGAMPGDRVAVRMPTTPQAITTLLGVLHAGAAYVPIDPDLPEDRAQHILSDSGARFLAHPDGEGATRIDLLEGPFPDRSTHDASHAGREPLAYVLYTSGSTGRPKGVQVPERAVTSLVDALAAPVYDGLGDGLRVALLASLAFDASVQQIFGALLRGHTLVLIDPEVKRDPVRLCHELVEHGVDVADCTPSLLQLLTAHAAPSLRRLPLRRLLVGGERLPAGTVARFHELGAPESAVVVNVYGLTESGVDSVAQVVRGAGGFHPAREDVPIGKSLTNSEVRVTDRSGRPVPRGAVGEIRIAGPCVALGYTNDEALTEERFCPRPGRPAERVLRTGDRGWMDESDALHFAGRRDGQVKIRGHRVELGEIERVLGAHPDVESAAVIAYRTPGGDIEPAAFVAGPAVPRRAEIRAHLKQSLPAVMVPRLITSVPEIPLSSSGKLDAQTLLALLHRGGSGGEGPDRGLADLVLDTLRGVLDDPLLGPDEDFFEAGGHSILALRAVSALSRALDRDVSLRSLHDHPTADALTRHLHDSRSGSATRVVPLRPSRHDALPVFFLPPAAGIPYIFTDLVGELPTSYAPWGVDYLTPDGSVEATLHELAEALAEELLLHTDHTVVPLVGYSLGAAVAFDLARLLERRGRRPALVLIDRMLNPPAPSAERTTLIEGAEHTDVAARLDVLLPLAAGHTTHGVVESPMVTLEAAGNPVPAGMTSWRAHTTGSFHHTVIPGSHHTLLAPEHLPALREHLQHSLSLTTGR